MLILFDIDMTLISSFGAGAKAMRDAGRETYGDSFTTETTEFAGRLDPLIIDDLLRNNGRDISAETRAAMRSGYRRHLERRLAVPGTATALPGVIPLLDALRAHARVAVGVLTGNFSDTGAMKLRAAGIDPNRFEIAVWGDESPHMPPKRADLPPIGMRRYQDRRGRSLEPTETIIIGDTPDDAACALAHGLRCLGVATGHFSAERLAAARFDHVVADLSDTPAILSWMRIADPAPPSAALSGRCS